MISSLTAVHKILCVPLLIVIVIHNTLSLDFLIFLHISVLVLDFTQSDIVAVGRVVQSENTMLDIVKQIYGRIS